MAKTIIINNTITKLNHRLSIIKVVEPTTEEVTTTTPINILKTTFTNMMTIITIKSHTIMISIKLLSSMIPNLNIIKVIAIREDSSSQYRRIIKVKVNWQGSKRRKEQGMSWMKNGPKATKPKNKSNSEELLLVMLQVTRMNSWTSRVANLISSIFRTSLCLELIRTLTLWIALTKTKLTFLIQYKQAYGTKAKPKCTSTCKEWEVALLSSLYTHNRSSKISKCNKSKEKWQWSHGNVKSKKWSANAKRPTRIKTSKLISRGSVRAQLPVFQIRVHNSFIKIWR